MPCYTSDEPRTTTASTEEFGGGSSNLPIESSTFIDGSSTDVQVSRVTSFTINQTPSHSPFNIKKQIQFDAITFPAEEFSGSTTSRRNGTLISEVEIGTNILPAEVYCICDGTASDEDHDDLGDDGSLHPRFTVLPGESEEDPPRTYRLVYDLKQYARLGWRIPGPQLQSRSHATRKSSQGFMQPKPSRLVAKAQHHRAYRARMAYLECQVEVAHCLDRLATAANSDEDLWPELKRVLGLE